MRAYGFLLLTVPLSLAGCESESSARVWRASDHQEPSGSDPASQANPDDSAVHGGGASEEAQIRMAAAALFRDRCAGCHGESGRGDGPMASGLNVPDLTSATLQDGRSDEELAQVIQSGRGMMPGFGSEVTSSGIRVLVAHVRSLRSTEE